MIREPVRDFMLERREALNNPALNPELHAEFMSLMDVLRALDTELKRMEKQAPYMQPRRY